jgi:nucleoside triphosphate pyrophosphatase
MLHERLKNHTIILASKSPRRQYLLKELGIEYKIDTSLSIDEEFSNELKAEEIALFLAEEKAKAFEGKIDENDIVITADTIVWIDNHVLNKPRDRNDAFSMLKQLSGNMHKVLTGVCIKSKSKTVSFYAETKVYFKELSNDEIEFYIDNYKPFDKAGSYGIQEWIGYVGIESIEGSYFNVMGLPIQKLYEELNQFINN